MPDQPLARDLPPDAARDLPHQHGGEPCGIAEITLAGSLARHRARAFDSIRAR